LQEVAGLTGPDSVYMWQGFCDALQVMDSVGKGIYEGSGEYKLAQEASNIASLLAQCKHESAIWTACDENWWNVNAPQGSCSQRPDNALYHEITGPGACPVDPNMRMTAVTRGGGMKEIKCDPDTPEFSEGTRKCCWWGRGAIQTTGPLNYGLLNTNIVQKASLPELANVDLCTDPEAMCKPEYPSLRWLGALEYWNRVVQGFDEFNVDLKAFVDNGFVDSPSIGFNNGCGSAVNNGVWNGHAHGEAERQAHFEELIAALVAAGMKGGEPGSIGGNYKPLEPEVFNCCGSSWAAAANSGRPCPGGTDAECKVDGETCFADLPSCGE